MSEADDKTEEATPERKRKAREEGQFARSKDAAGTAASIAVIAVLALSASHIVGILADFMTLCLKSPYPGENVNHLLDRSMATLSRIVMPATAAAAVAAGAVGFAEAGFHPNFSLMAPKWNRLDPVAKLKNMFSPGAAAMSTSLSLMRVVAVGAVAYWVTREALPELLSTGQSNLGAGVALSATACLELAVWSSLVLAVLAGAEYAFNLVKHNRQLRMSRHEIKEELKQAEGNPEMRARRRMRAREFITRGLEKQVRESDVVVVNPTHYAVALRYRPRDGAPVVAAKGVDDIALHIRQLAEKHGVIVIENRPLARALVASARVGRAIPPDFYEAVAAILAVVYRTRGRGLTA